MNEEFAIEPTVFRSQRDVQYVLEKFGFHHGRFICSLPNAWVKRVYEQIEKLPDGPKKIRTKRIVEKAMQRGALVNSRFDYKPDQPWLTNVITSGKEFKGILVSEETNSAVKINIRTTDQKNVCILDEIDDDSFFGNSREEKIFYTIEEFSRVADKLLSISHEVCLIDPHFNFYSKSYINVLDEFISIGLAGKCKLFKIYTSAHGSKFDGIQKILDKNFKGSGAFIEVNHVEKTDTEDFHARYLFSKSGGIRFDYGFRLDDKAKRDVAAIDLNLHKELCKLYLDGETCHKIKTQRCPK